MSTPGTGDVSGAMRAFAERCGEVFVSFESQDSGCVSYGVDAGPRRWFLKAPATDIARERLASVLEFHRSVRHAVIVRPVEVVEVDGVPVLRFPWVDGETLYHATTNRSGPDVRNGPDAPHARFRRLPVDQIIWAIDAVFSAHVEIAREGFVAIDLYDGCLHYDFERRRMRLIDLDEYRPGPVRVPGSLLPGSTRFRSPEELVPGGLVDSRSTVYALGRVAQVLLDEGDDEGRWRGSAELAEVAARATATDPADRYGTVAELAGAWRAAASIAD
jgi:hypothetical protein